MALSFYLGKQIPFNQFRMNIPIGHPVAVYMLEHQNIVSGNIKKRRNG